MQVEPGEAFLDTGSATGSNDEQHATARGGSVADAGIVNSLQPV